MVTLILLDYLNNEDLDLQFVKGSLTAEFITFKDQFSGAILRIYSVEKCNLGRLGKISL